MRLQLNPHDQDRLNVELTLSADEVEHWIARLQSAVRRTREGQGDQLLLFGEPARIVVTVQERNPMPEPDRLPLDDRWGARIDPQRLFAFGQAGVILFVMLVVLMWLMLRFSLLPL